jgi:acyl carrier protein
MSTEAPTPWVRQVRRRARPLCDNRRVTGEPREISAARVVEVVSDVARTLHPDTPVPPVNLDTRLEKDLGIDSLSRIELVTRLEDRLEIELADGAVTAADSVGDVLEAVRKAVPEGVRVGEVAPGELGGRPVQAAEEAKTLVEVLRWHAERHPERLHVRFYDESWRAHELTYGGLLDRASRVASSLRRQNVEVGEMVAIMLPSGLEYFTAFYGALLAGAVPVPLYPPVRPRQIEDHLRRQEAILRTAQAVVLVTTQQIGRIGALLRPTVPSLRRVVTASELEAGDAGEGCYEPASDEVAFLQFTSGSTGDPKGVVLDHRNLLANLRAMGAAARLGDEVVVSWLPLYHDMGLIGAWMGSLYYGYPLVLMSPLSFLGRPQRWLWTIHEHRGTLSAAPNFAYELCLKKIRDEDLTGLDLSSWRLALNGAETVSPRTIERFVERFAPYGFRAETMTPVYGLAESSVGLAFSPPHRAPRIDRIERDTFRRTGRAAPAEIGDAAALEFVSSGSAIPGHELRVVDSNGAELGERREGTLLFRGPSSTRGYYRNPEATARLFRDGWLDTGDMAYLADGELFVTGRVKDLIIRAGRNIYPHEIEEAVSGIEGVRQGCVVAFGSPDPESGTERLVVVAETREIDAVRRQGLSLTIREVVSGIVGDPPDAIALVRPQTVLKTSSGKIRRSATRELWEAGNLERVGAPPWLQLARVGLGSARAAVAGLGGRLVELAWGLWVWNVAAWIAGPAIVALLVVPGLGLRRRLAHTACRMWAALSGLRLEIAGLELLPTTAHVVVVNHASYADGLLLTAALPPTHAYVVKREARAWPVFGRVLARLGTLFIERFDREEAVSDTRRAGTEARRGESLVFFAEGTFRRSPGLLPFRLGAFVTASESGLPVVPVALRGSRRLLPDGRWIPRRTPIIVEALPRLEPEGIGWDAALALRDRARAAILARVEEPDANQG